MTSSATSSSQDDCSVAIAKLPEATQVWIRNLENERRQAILRLRGVSSKVQGLKELQKVMRRQVVNLRAKERELIAAKIAAEASQRSQSPPSSQTDNPEEPSLFSPATFETADLDRDGSGSMSVHSLRAPSPQSQSLGSAGFPAGWRTGNIFTPSPSPLGYNQPLSGPRSVTSTSLSAAGIAANLARNTRHKHQLDDMDVERELEMEMEMERGRESPTPAVWGRTRDSQTTPPPPGFGPVRERSRERLVSAHQMSSMGAASRPAPRVSSMSTSGSLSMGGRGINTTFRTSKSRENPMPSLHPMHSSVSVGDVVERELGGERDTSDSDTSSHTHQPKAPVTPQALAVASTHLTQTGGDALRSPSMLSAQLTKKHTLGLSSHSQRHRHSSSPTPLPKASAVKPGRDAREVERERERDRVRDMFMAQERERESARLLATDTTVPSSFQSYLSSVGGSPASLRANSGTGHRGSVAGRPSQFRPSASGRRTSLHSSIKVNKRGQGFDF
ncbi:hypothetical protein KIPB_003542 [Kipferlia bialata]|uniref:Uncharacterized protein n=1 Tax=Kipferlia bialata TaxID=797122 RepID=A0A9K3CQR6_9EUKA|nr:hypothetical protein KIPB_002426 [Kipferlia bialata]GIQ82411.1 hypothetical protein KIPB_003542 [Kipferlia bialata]|eukprot:g2426.t1